MRNSALHVVQRIGTRALLRALPWVGASLNVGCASEMNDFPADTRGDAGTSTDGGAGSPTTRISGGGAVSTSSAGAGGAASSIGAGSGGRDPDSAGVGGLAGSHPTAAGGTAGAASFGGSNGVSGAAGSASSGGSNGAGAGGTGSAGVAGSAGAAGSTAKPSICDGAATRTLSITDAKVDDFEGPAISPSWSSFNDVMPVPNAFSIVQATSDGAATTTKCGHYQGAGARSLPNGGYGVGTVYNIAIDKAQGKYCIDISVFDGVSFWAKAAKNGANVEVNFVVPETNATQDGGDCTNGCYNHPRMPVTLTTEWKRYSVTFASAGGGAHGVANRIQELAWLAPLDSDWDFSIDEIAFYKGAAPPGPVGATH